MSSARPCSRYANGLSDVPWVGVVRNSKVIDALEKQNRIHPAHEPCRFERLTHYVVLMKECVAEVIAETVSLTRLPGTTLDAVCTAMGK